MEPTELAVWLALANSVSFNTAKHLLDEFGNAQAIGDASGSQLKQVLGEKAGKLTRLIDDAARPEYLEAITDWLASSPANSLLTFADPGYPDLLQQIPDPPVMLFTRGDIGLLKKPLVAMVGSRNPTADGEHNARAFAHYLVRAGTGIVSGMAAGIDAAAHAATLDAGGDTIAVIGTGIDRIYPASNRELAHRIAESGLIVSEFPLGTPPMKANFPRRNRIISGLALGTLVVEAAAKSGSLITARLAGEQGREVFAIPGSIHAPMAKGCNWLIRQGAKLVESGEHIIEELGPISAAVKLQQDDAETDSPLEMSDDQRQVYAHIGHDPVSLDQLVERSGLTPEQVSSMLSQLEILGWVAAQHGNRFVRSARS